jgi:hypothetical protein
VHSAGHLTGTIFYLATGQKENLPKDQDFTFPCYRVNVFLIRSSTKAIHKPASWQIKKRSAVKTADHQRLLAI